MKNIHVLPTEQPSRIYLIKSNNKLGITSNNPEFTENFGSGTQNQNLFITSDEEIKQGDFFYSVRGVIEKAIINYPKGEHFGKLILTTDQNLIKDGVQAIDDKFLRWFVKNPNCESIKVSYEVLKPFQSEEKGYILRLPDTDVLEEPKPHSFCETPNEKCTMNYCDENGCQNRKRELVEPKQETLEEVAQWVINNRYANSELEKVSDFEMYNTIIDKCSKWQQEQDKNKYSEEEVLKLWNWLNDGFIIRKSLPTREELIGWFEQFKDNQDEKNHN